MKSLISASLRLITSLALASIVLTTLFLLIVFIFEMNQQGDDQEWEISKENVMPIKEGRSVDSLNQALQLGTPQHNKTIESKIK